jgi:hypothetical protein
MFLFLSIAFAQEFVTEIGEPVELRSAGAWVRVLPDEEGWKVALGSNQSFYVAELNKTGEGFEDWEMSPKYQVTETSGLIDHAIKKCPDGSYLHVASGNANDGTQNDMAHIWHYDANFSVLGYQSFTEGIGTHSHNDPNLICSSIAVGVAFSIQGFDFATDLFVLNSNLEVTDVIPLEPYPRANGGAMLTDEVEKQVHFIGMAHNQPLHINSYDEDWTLLASNEADILGQPLRAYWPQGFIEVGDYYLIAHMGKDDSWLGSDKGDVFLSVLDKQFDFIEQYRITSYEDGDAAMRPWVARRGSQLLLSFDAYNEQMIVEARIDLAAFGLDQSSPDTGVSPNGKWIEESTKQKCRGCNAASAAICIPLIFIGFLRRKE